MRRALSSRELVLVKDGEYKVEEVGRRGGGDPWSVKVGRVYLYAHADRDKSLYSCLRKKGAASPIRVRIRGQRAV